ncbi:hypothetical protein U4960_13890 [Altererythrobacter sp. H2]|nr:hypothetical protein [Altererythrobacter sp. H2]WRK95369.1 hypothetical protein U4960_13890 [Altererythrobacter sp. H2]
MTETDQEKEDEVLKRLLQMSHKPHKKKGDRPKPAPQDQKSSG